MFHLALLDPEMAPPSFLILDSTGALLNDNYLPPNSAKTLYFVEPFTYLEVEKKQC